MSVSGWCSGPAGACSSPKAHRVCQMRMNDGLLECDCTLHTPVPTGRYPEQASAARALLREEGK